MSNSPNMFLVRYRIDLVPGASGYIHITVHGKYESLKSYVEECKTFAVHLAGI